MKDDNRTKSKRKADQMSPNSSLSKLGPPNKKSKTTTAEACIIEGNRVIDISLLVGFLKVLKCPECNLSVHETVRTGI